MTTEQKFNAAVNVIRSLPKNGSYQPSNDLMLRFYSYFKQATIGPCEGSRPAFWDVVGRAKYDAWKKLGNLSKQEAMNSYVDELHRIVETMSYTDKVANFLEAPTDEIDTINIADLELIAGDVLERVRSQPNSPFGSRDASPQRIHSSLGTSPVGSSNSPSDSDHSDDEYIDTIEATEPPNKLSNGLSEPISNGISYKEHKSRSKVKLSQPSYHIDTSSEIAKTMQCLRADIDRLMSKVNSLENVNKNSAVVKQRNPSFLKGVSPQFLAFVVIWPFVMSIIVNRYFSRK